MVRTFAFLRKCSYLCRCIGHLIYMSAKTKYCRVAEHTFSLNASEQWFGLLSNYTPFEIAEGVSEPIFTLTAENNGMLSPEGVAQLTPLFVDSSDEDMPRIEVYRQDDQWLFRIAMVANAPVCCELWCSSDFRQARLCFASSERNVRFCFDNAMMLLFAFRTAALRTLEMHAAVVVKDGRGFLFLGKSGTGKSTHARQWLQAFDDAWLLNDDNPILRVMDNGEVRVFGSPWSGKTPCYKNESAPVEAIVKLSQAPKNTLRRLRLPEAYAYILSSASGLKTERNMADAIYETIRAIVLSTPCYHLDCLPNTDAARTCYGERE